jgi:hypothetical protein
LYKKIVKLVHSTTANRTRIWARWVATLHPPPPDPASNPPDLALPVNDPRSTSISARSSASHPTLRGASLDAPSRGSAGVDVAPRGCKVEDRESHPPRRVLIEDCCWRWPAGSGLASGNPVHASAVAGSVSWSAVPPASCKLWSPSSSRLMPPQGSPPVDEGSFPTIEGTIQRPPDRCLVLPRSAPLCLGPPMS